MDGREIGHVASSEHQTSPVYFPPRLLKPGLWGCIGPLVYWQKKRNVLPPKRAHSLETVRQQVVCQRHRTAGVGGACLLGCGRGPQLPPFCAFFRQTSQNSLAGSQVIRTIFFTPPCYLGRAEFSGTPKGKGPARLFGEGWLCFRTLLRDHFRRGCSPVMLWKIHSVVHGKRFPSLQ